MVKEYSQNLLSSLWQLRCAGTFCDTVLIVGGNVEIEAHAVVLGAASSRLGAMLQQNGSHGTDNLPTCQYRLNVIDYDIDTVAALLEFIYTGEASALASLSCSYKDDMTALCRKFGITVDDYFTANDSTVELTK